MGPKGSVKTYALLDSGSNVTLCSDELIQSLGIKGESKSYNLSGIGGTKVTSGQGSGT